MSHRERNENYSRVIARLGTGRARWRGGYLRTREALLRLGLASCDRIDTIAWTTLLARPASFERALHG